MHRLKSVISAFLKNCQLTHTNAFSPNNATQSHSIFLKLEENTFLGMPKVTGKFLDCQCPRSKFQVICQKMAMFEQLNDQLLVNSK